MPPVPIDEPLGYRRGRRVSCNEAVGTAPIPHGHAIVNSPPPNHSPQPKDQSVRYGGPYSSTPWDRPRRVIAKVEHHLGELVSPSRLHRHHAGDEPSSRPLLQP